MKRYIRYVYAILAVPLSLLLRAALIPLTGYNIPYITLFPVTVGVALLAGLSPAILTGFLGSIVTDYFFVEPLHTIALDVPHVTRTAVMVLTSVFVGYVGAGLRAAGTKAEKQAEELSENERRLKLALDAAEAAPWETDLVAGKVVSSPRMAKIYGVDQSRLPRTRDEWRAFVIEEDRGLLEPAIDAAAHGDGKHRLEFRIRRPDGVVRWIRSEGQLHKDEHGRPCRITGLLTDITERKRAEVALRESEAKYRIVADNTYDYEFWIDQQGRYLYASPACKRIMGYSPEDFIRDPGLRRKAVHPDDASILDRHIEEDEKGHKASEAQYRIVRADGSVRWISHACQPIFSDRGEYSGLRGSNRDITERKRMEEELRRSRDELERRVEERTAELQQTNERLKEENEERVRTEQSLRLEEARLDALFRLSQISDAPLNEITGFTLEQAIALTRSKIGFVGFLNEEETVYTLHSVSKDVVKECNVEGNPVHWPVSDAGIWADAIRERRTVFVNDYSKPHPRKKGIPAGHVPIERFMVVPAFDGERIVAVAGVGNKASDYDNSDERQMTLLLGGMWNYVQRKRSMEALQERTAELLKVNEEVNIEITQRKQAETAVHAERQRFSEVLDMLPAYVVLLTPDHHVPFANRFFEERFGKSNGKRCFEYLFNRAEPCEICETYKVLTTNQPHHWEWTGPDGRNYDISDFPFTDVDGSPLIMEMGIDVTEQKRAQEGLRSASLYSRGLIEASLDPLVTISPEGEITDVNEATEQATGVARGQLVGSDFSDYFTEPEEARAGYQQVLREGMVRDYPLTIRHVSGRTTDVLYNATVYRNEAGQVQGVFAAARDVTEKKAAEAELGKYRLHLEDLVKQRTAELARSNKDLEQFAYVASHDLQEPLRAVSGFVELLKRRLQGSLDAKATEYMDFTTDGAARMQSLISGLLEYSRVGTQGKKAELTDSKAAVDEAMTRLQMSMRESGAKTTVDDLPTVRFDPVQLTQLFQNLIGNAIKFHSERPPRIQISAVRLEDAWRFAVADNGIGIEPEYAERIFLIFQRLHSREKYPGTGMGLAICKKIVERHNGKIWVESKRGSGSTFYFTIPFAGEIDQ